MTTPPTDEPTGDAGNGVILIIAPLYAPDRSPRAYRWTAIAEHWAAEGKRVAVVAAWRPGDARYEERNGVSVHRVGGAVVERLRHWLGVGARRDGAPSSPRATALYRATLRRLLWPDYLWHWYLPALFRALRICAGGEVTGLITVSPPFTPQLVGLTLRRLGW